MNVNDESLLDLSLVQDVNESIRSHYSFVLLDKSTGVKLVPQFNLLKDAKTGFPIGALYLFAIKYSKKGSFDSSSYQS